MSSNSVRTDNSALSRSDQFLFKIESILNLSGGLVILALILTAVVHIVGRKMFGAAVPDFNVWVSQSMVICAVLGISYCHRLGGHIRMDIVVGRFSGRSLWATEILGVVLMMIVTAALIYGSYSHFERSVNGTLSENLEVLFSKGLLAFFTASSSDSAGDLNLPLWPAKLLVPIAFTLLFLRLALHLWGYIRAFIRNDTTPVAVPMLEDAVTQAKNEAESISDAIKKQADNKPEGEKQ